MSEMVFFNIVILLAGFTQGFTGFGSVLVALPLLTLFLDVRMAVPLVTLFSLVINIVLFFQVHKHLNFARIRLLFAASIPGIFCGVYILKEFPTLYLEAVIGVILVTFPTYLLRAKEPVREMRGGWPWLFGFLSGLLGGSIAASGPPVIIYTSLQPWDKHRIKSTLVGYFLLSTIAVIIVQGINGLITEEVTSYFLAGYPVLVISVLAGSLLFERVESGSYRKILNVLLVGLGCFMLVKIVAASLL
jgi:uncharacterized membrane protein YfcA